MSYTTCSVKPAWPGIILIIILIVILAGIAFSGKDVPSKQKIWTFVSILIFGVVWLFVIYWFCVVGYTVLGWFFLLLPILFYAGWWLALLLARVTSFPECIAGEGGVEFMWPLPTK